MAHLVSLQVESTPDRRRAGGIGSRLRGNGAAARSGRPSACRR